MEAIDQIHLNFSEGSLWILNTVLALLMFGVALELTPRDFLKVVRNPKSALVGLLCQFIILPAATFLLIQWIRPPASVALGMMLVAACPGGNVSNIIVYMSGGNAALSVGMTAVSSMAATILTPFNFTFWASRDAETSALLSEVAIGPWAILASVALLLGIPMIIGMSVGAKFPKFATRVRDPLHTLCGVVFGLFILAALFKNRDILTAELLPVIAIVILHNSMALSVGYGVARLARLEARDLRTVTIEVGIQNSGLALGIIFSVFHGLGGMALIAMLWGVWHIIAGSLLARFWAKRIAVEASA